MVQLLQDDMYRSRLQQLGFRIWGLGLGAEDLGFRVDLLGLRILGSRFGVSRARPTLQ